MNNDTNNLCAEGFTIYLSTYEALVQLAESDPKLAFEYFAALANYNFYGEEYNGANIMVKLMAQQQYPLIEKQRERYNKSIKGGQSKKEQIPWEDIVAAAQTGEYTTLQALGVRFGTSGQNIGRRLKNHNTSLAELIEQGKNEMIEPIEPNETNSANLKLSNEKFRTFENFEPIGTPFLSPETNPTNSNNNNNSNNNSVTPENNSKSWAGKSGIDRASSLV